MLLKKKKQCNCINVEQHKTNLLNLQCDSDSNFKKNDLLLMFKYQILSIKVFSLSVTTQNSQKKCDYDCSLNSILNKNVRITKKKIQKKCKLSTLKTLCFDQ